MMAAFWRREADQMAKRCWQCDAKLPSTGSLCARCGATRVQEERVPNLAIPANGWYAPPDVTDVPKRYASRQTRTDTTASDAPPATGGADAQEQSIYTPPVFDAEVYASRPVRGLTTPKEYDGRMYTPPPDLYDVPEYAGTKSEEPDATWLSRFQD
jgi:hypothetical protein